MIFPRNAIRTKQNKGKVMKALNPFLGPDERGNNVFEKQIKKSFFFSSKPLTKHFQFSHC